ncbi:Isochorismatase domain-containing protein 1 [Lamellibrachia satsuma]|nr:Isochorismatase domain-containing protein 1 [Lamellibrachia satsuma]
MQEKFKPVIAYFKEILEVAKKLTTASKYLDIPLVVTEQYPKGLGSTMSELKVDHAAGLFHKTKFSMVIPEVEKLMSSLCNGNVRHIVLFGIEAHVCIQQTVIDLLERGYEVHVVVDATSSRNHVDRMFAFERFRQAGAIVTTCEAVLLQLVGDKEHPQFKWIQTLIMSKSPNSGLVPITKDITVDPY